MLAAVDFSSARVALVASVPGTHRGPQLNRWARAKAGRQAGMQAQPGQWAGPWLPALAPAPLPTPGRRLLLTHPPTPARPPRRPCSWGHMRVRALLAREQLPGGLEAAPLVCQCSSMGSLSLIWLRTLVASFSAAAGYGEQPQQPQPQQPQQPQQQPGQPRHAPGPGTSSSGQGGRGARGGPSQEAAPAGGRLPLGQLHFVWPAVDEVQNCTEGWRGGGGIPGTMSTVGRTHLRALYSRWALAAVGSGWGRGQGQRQGPWSAAQAGAAWGGLGRLCCAARSVAGPRPCKCCAARRSAADIRPARCSPAAQRGCCCCGAQVWRRGSWTAARHAAHEELLQVGGGAWRVGGSGGSRWALPTAQQQRATAPQQQRAPRAAHHLTRPPRAPQVPGPAAGLVHAVLPQYEHGSLGPPGRRVPAAEDPQL
jgi:hypothetical protein